MNQPRRILRNTAALTAADLAQRIGNILLAFVIARVSHASGLGVYSTAVAYYSLITVGGVLGANSYVVREIAKDLTKTSHYFTHLSLLGILASLGMVGLLLLALPYLGYSAELSAAIYVVAIAVPAAVVKTLQRAVFVAHQKAGFVAWTTGLLTLVNFGVCIYLMVQGFSIVSLLVVLVVVEYAGVFIYLYLIHRFIAPLSLRFSLRDGYKLLLEIKSFAALSILGALFNRPEVILLSVLCDEAEVGLFVAALKVVNLCHFLPEIYMTSVFPVLSRSYQESAQKFRFIQDSSIKYLLVLALPLTIGTMVVARPIIDILYGPGFDKSVLLLQILVWSLPIQALMAVLWRVLAARNQQSLDLRGRVISIVVRLGGGYALIAMLASLGASLCVVGALLFNTFLLIRYVNLEGGQLSLSRLGWRCAVAAVGMGAATWLLNQELQLWAVVPLSVVIYAALAIAFKVLSAEDVALFRRAWEPAILRRS